MSRIFFLSISDYVPNSEVFDQVEGGKPWWGILGLNYYGKGMKSIEGPSEESRFLGNPYLLCGLVEAWLFTPSTIPKDLTPYYPRIESFVWQNRSRRLSGTYNVSDYLARLHKLGARGDWTADLSIAAYNARDLGFSHIALPESLQDGIKLEKPSPPFAIPHMLHAGPSSRYPGRSNNMSPECDSLDFRVVQLPALLVIHLYRQQPAPNQPPDFRCVFSLR